MRTSVVRGIRSLVIVMAVLTACASGTSPIGLDAGVPDAAVVGECRSTEDCRGFPSQPQCDEAGGRCVQCLSSTQCPSGETCGADEICHGTQPCSSEHECDDGSVCAPDGFCVLGTDRCHVDADCIDPLKRRCDVTALACVACLADAQCESYEQCTFVETCGPRPGRCRADADCSGTADTPACDVTNHVCVQCLSDAECPSLICTAHVCAPSGSCHADAACASVAGRPRCDTTSMQCVACLSDADCAHGACVSSQCRPSCSADTDCAGIAGTPHCDLGSNTCVECSGSDQCSPGQSCSTGVCVTAPGATCQQILTCQQLCTDQSCRSDCFNAGTIAAKTYFQALISCTYGPGACSDAFGGVCDSLSADYSESACVACVTSALGGTGSCASEAQACQVH